MRIEIKDSNVVVGSITTAKGSRVETRSQEAFFSMTNGEVFKIRVSVGRDAAPYSAGQYVLSDDSFTKGEYGDLQLVRNIVLRPAVVSGSGGPAK